MKRNHRIKPATAVLLGLSLLLAPFAEAAAATAAKPGKAPSMPPAKEVIARFVKILGGKEAFAKIDSQWIKGKMEMPAQGISGELEGFAKRPDKLLIKVTLPALGEMLQGYDGKVGWALNAATGPMVLDGPMLEQVREQARFDALLHDDTEFNSMQTIGLTQFEGRECYQLKLVRKSGQESTEFYDTQTGLLVGSTEKQETPLGVITVTSLPDEYKKFGDLLFATKVTQKLGPLSQIMRIASIEFNRVEDSVFELPEPIKALVKP